MTVEETGAGPDSENDGQQFDRLPATAEVRTVDGRATRGAVIEYWSERFGVPPETWEDYSFWEKGAGKIWVVRGAVRSPISIEALGMRILHTRQEHWKPTTNGVQRFGKVATRNVLEVDRPQATRFVRGEEQPLSWEGEWGYLIVATEIANELHPLGVGLFTHGTLRSQIPKGRRFEPKSAGKSDK